VWTGPWCVPAHLCGLDHGGSGTKGPRAARSSRALAGSARLRVRAAACGSRRTAAVVRLFSIELRISDKFCAVSRVAARREIVSIESRATPRISPLEPHSIHDARSVQS
jgi:hypothetical protein